MLNPEMNNSDNFESGIEALLEEMVGTTFTKSSEFDSLTGVTTEWTRREDGMYYARTDTLPSGVVERFMRDDKEDGHRDNFVTKQNDGYTVSTGYERDGFDTSPSFELEIKAQNETTKTIFEAMYTQDGILESFRIELNQSEGKRPDEGLLEENLQEIIDLYRLTGRSVFEAATPADLGDEIDLSGDIPRFTLGTWLPKRGYTEEDIGTVMTLASIPVNYHLDSTRALDEIPPEDSLSLREFLTIITARNLIPPVVEKSKRKLWFRYEDIDPETLEGFETLMRWYELSLSLFLSEQDRFIQRAGAFKARFTPLLDTEESYEFAIMQLREHGYEAIHEQTVKLGTPVRYERRLYQVEAADGVQVLTVQNLFSPKKDGLVIQFPYSFDAAKLKQALDSEDVSLWSSAHDLAPSHYNDPERML